MARVNHSSLVTVPLTSSDGAATSLAIEDVTVAETTAATTKASAATQNAKATQADEEKASAALTGAVKQVGKMTEKEETRNVLADAIEGRRGRKGKGRSRRKRAAVLRLIKEAGEELKSKVKVRFTRPGRETQVRTETGQRVSGSLNPSEASKVLTADDGSTVLLLNRRLKKAALVKEVNSFINDTFRRAADRNGVELGKDFFDALHAIVQASLSTMFFVETFEDLVNDGDESPEEEEARLVQEQAQRDQEESAGANARLETRLFYPTVSV